MSARVVAVSVNPAHGFSKPSVEAITLIAGQGVAGDAHCGATVKHRSRVARDPSQPNLRQVHLIAEELFADLAAKGFRVGAGQLGENITTGGIDLIGLGTDTDLAIGADVVLRVTGLRNPCPQLDRFQNGLMEAVLERRPDGGLVRKAGIMAVVVRGGTVRGGDAIRIHPPPGPFRPLDRV